MARLWTRLGPRRSAATVLALALIAAVALPLPLIGARATTPVPAGAAANRMLMWVSCGDVARLTDAQLASYHNLGVGGFVCETDWLDGMGGTAAFTNPAGNLSAPQYSLEQALVSSKVVARAHALGMTMYLSAYLVNYYNTQTPLGEWFNDASWSNTVLPSAARFASAAYLMGFDGLGFDEELYPQTGGAQKATWSWDYPGNTHTEQQVRAQVAFRGAQLMATLVNSFPQVEIVDYGTYLPGTWAAYEQAAVNGASNAYQNDVHLDFWNGLTQTPGYAAIRFLDSSFYKGPNVPRATFDAALQYNDNEWFALLSRSWSNWAYAADRVFVSPEAWIDGDVSNEGSWSAPRSPAFVATQLQEYRLWGMGGDFGVYSYDHLGQFNYGSYASGMQAAAAPGVVATEPPTISVTQPGVNSTMVSGTTVSLAGVANDPMAVRVVRWSDSQGGSGTAQLTWQILGGSASTSWTAQTNWVVPSIPLGPGPNTITVQVEDIKGLTALTSIQVTAPGAPTTTTTAPTTTSTTVTTSSTMTTPTTVTTPTSAGAPTSTTTTTADPAVVGGTTTTVLGTTTVPPNTVTSPPTTGLSGITVSPTTTIDPGSTFPCLALVSGEMISGTCSGTFSPAGGDPTAGQPPGS